MYIQSIKSVINSVSFAFALLIIPFQFSAQHNIETRAEINEVTVFSVSAKVSYSKEVSLKKGRNKVVFTDLSPYILENSVHASVAENSINIVTVSEKINYLKKSRDQRNQELTDSLEVKNRNLEYLTIQEEVLVKEKEMLFSHQGLSGVVDGVSVSEIEKASVFYNERITFLIDELYRLRKEKEMELQKINKIRNQLSQVSIGNDARISEIVLVLDSPSDKKVKVNFQFITDRAGWAPLYDLKYTNPNEDLQFVFRANIFNASNTNWNNVKIVLSTANPSLGLALPSLLEEEKKESVLNYKQQDIKLKTIQVANSITEYEIKYQYTIPSNGKPYLVEVDAYAMPSDYSYVIIPKVDNNGYLMADIPNWNTYDLISGTTNVYHNGAFLGRTFLKTITDNDTLNVYLGKDNKIEVYRKETSVEKSRIIVGNHIIDKTDINFEIRNNYNKVIKLKLIDQVPVFAKRDQVKMDVSGIDLAEYIAEEGSVTWNFSIQPNENLKRSFGFVAKAPKKNYNNYKAARSRMRTISCPSF